MMRLVLTETEWEVLLDAANSFEAEPANFEDDRSDIRLRSLRNVIARLLERGGRRS